MPRTSRNAVAKLAAALAGTAGAATLVLSARLATAQDAAPSFSPPTSAAELTQRLAEYDALQAHVVELAGTGRTDEAVMAGERLLPMARGMFGDTHELAAVTVLWLLEQKQALGQFEQARDLAEELLRIRLALYGDGDWRTADARFALARVKMMLSRSEDDRARLAEAQRKHTQAAWLYRQGRYDAAIPLVEEATRLFKEVLGADHQDYADSLNNVAELYAAKGDFVRALSLNQEVLSILEYSVGKEHPRYAFSLRNRANHYKELGEYDQALPLNVESRAIYLQTEGNETPGYADSVNGLAVLYHLMWNFDQAIPLYQEALKIYGTVLGKEDRAYANSLTNLAFLYQSMGDYPRAPPLYEEAAAIVEKTLGKDHPQYALTLNNFGTLYQAMGDDAEALRLFMQAREIWATSVGREHHSYANTLNSIAFLYAQMGDYARAFPLYEEARAIRAIVLGNNHPDYAVTLNNLALLLEEIGEQDQALQLFQESSRILKDALGADHPNYATSLNNLARIYYSIGDFGEALRLYEESSELRRRTLGTKHPDFAQSLHNLAGTHQAQGNFAEALQLCEGALAIWKELLGREHPNYAVSLGKLAAIHQSMGEDVRALALYHEALTLTLSHLDRTAATQTEHQQLAARRMLAYVLYDYLSCVLDAGAPAEEAFAAALSWKGGALLRQRAMRLAADDPQLADLFEEFQSVTWQWAAMIQATPPTEEPQATNFRERRASLDAERERLELELSRRSADFSQAMQRPTPAELAACLPPDAALVDYLEFNHYRAKPGGGWVSTRTLLAFVVRPGRAVQLFELGPAEAIGNDVDLWRASFGTSDEGLQAGAELRHAIWDPLLQALHGTSLVLVSPDGPLGRLPLAALPGAAPESYLLEDHRLAMVAVPQLIPALENDPHREHLEKALLVMAPVDFGPLPDELATPVAAETGPIAREGQSVDSFDAELPPSAEARAFDGIFFGRLDGTQAEAASIANLYRQRAKRPELLHELQGARATEAAFREWAPKSRVLHLATHGFFAPADRESAWGPAKRAAEEAETQRRRMGLDEDNPFVSGFNPGVLSGIALANANRASVQTEGTDDGILTASDIAVLRLEGANLVVLSACETGLGEVAGGEGLLGIQRAFQVSGVRRTIATLWKVDDAMTERLMTAFYRNVLHRKQSCLDALRNAQLEILRELRDHPDEFLAELQAAGAEGQADRKAQLLSDETPVTHGAPYFWAAFTLSGDWR
jgi:CHAT domain-containing protein/tetratricopeptide (TPR) repeat protein